MTVTHDFERRRVTFQATALTRQAGAKNVIHATQKPELIKSDTSFVRPMAQSSIPKVLVDEKVEIAVYVVGVLAASAAAYHVGETGDWEPLATVALGLALVVLFVTSEA